MTDVVSPVIRSRMMAGIRAKNTHPERLIRSLLHRQGFRFRIHVSDLPGKPDLVFRKYKAVVFVHGCFWHRHGCHLFKWPSSRKEFWEIKIKSNERNDIINSERLAKSGWRVLNIWECSLKGKKRLASGLLTEKIRRWLISDKKSSSIHGK